MNDGKQIAAALYGTKSGTPSEATIHKQVIEWAELQESAMPELKSLFHPPNGGHRTKATAAKMKAMGAKAGVPDLQLPIVRPGVGLDGGVRRYGALWIELKSKSGRLRDTQAAWRDRLRQGGHAWALCRSFEAAQRCLRDYIAGHFHEAHYDPEVRPKAG